MTYMLKLKRAQVAAVINALESIITEIQEQAGEQEQAARQPKEQEAEPD